jgi:uncharacterized lipoprotein YbaY
MRLYSYTEAELTALANQILEVVATGLHKEGILPEDPEHVCGKYTVLIAEPTVFGRIWNKIRGGVPNEPTVTISLLRATDTPGEATPE